jgi:hypothetical protein
MIRNIQEASSPGWIRDPQKQRAVPSAGNQSNPIENVLERLLVKEVGRPEARRAVAPLHPEVLVEEWIGHCDAFAMQAPGAQPRATSPSRSIGEPDRASRFATRHYSPLQRRADVAWMIGRAEAMTNPEAARRKALEKLRGLTKLDDPEGLVVPILLDALLMVESYRGARHQISFLPELTRSIDDLLRELTIVEKAEAWAAE